MDLQSIIGYILPDPAYSRLVADKLRADYPNLSVGDLIHQATHSAKIKAAITGAATGVASSPLTMIPAALADMVAVLRIEALLIGAIAALLDSDALNDPHALRMDVITVLFPAAASQALRQVGIRAGERLSMAVMRRYATADFTLVISRLATSYLGRKITRDALLEKAVPLVGMGIGAGWNWLEVQAIGLRAVRYYSDEPIGPVLQYPRLPSPRNIWGKVRRYAPILNRQP